MCCHLYSLLCGPAAASLSVAGGMPLIPVLQMPLMFQNLQGGEAGQGLDLQATLAAMQASAAAGGSGSMVVAGGDGTAGVGAAGTDAQAAVSQALQFAQLANSGQLPALLSLSMQPDGSGGLVNANGQRMQLPGGLNMPLQLQGGLQILSAEGLQQLSSDGGAGMPGLVQVLPQADGSGLPVSAEHQAAVEAAVAAAAASGQGMAGLQGLLPGLGGILDPSTIAAAAAAAAAGVTAGAVPNAALEAAAAAAAAAAGGVADAAEGGGLPAAELPGGGAGSLPLAADGDAAGAAAAAGDAADMPGASGVVGAPTDGDGQPVPAATGEEAGQLVAPPVSALPAIAPLHMSSTLEAGSGGGVETLTAPSSGAPGAPVPAGPGAAPGDEAAATLVALSNIGGSEKRNAALMAMAEAQAALTAVSAGIYTQAAADVAYAKALRLAQEADAEDVAAGAAPAAAAAADAGAAEALLQQQAKAALLQQQLAAATQAGGGGDAQQSSAPVDDSDAAGAPMAAPKSEDEPPATAAADAPPPPPPPPIEEGA